MSDVTKRGEIFGLGPPPISVRSTIRSPRRAIEIVMPGGNATLGRLQSNTWSDTTNYGVRAREELVDADAPDGGGDRLGNNHDQGFELDLRRSGYGRADILHHCSDRQFQNTAPEVALLYKPNNEWLFRDASLPAMERRRSEISLSLPAGKMATTRSSRRRRTSAMISASTGRRTALKFSATGFYEFFRNELVTQATQVANQLHVQRATVGASRGRTGR